MLNKILIISMGLIFLVGAIYSIYVGYVNVGGNSSFSEHHVYRASQPIEFWMVVIAFGGLGSYLLKTGLALGKDVENSE